MEIEDNLAAELQIQLIIEASDAVQNGGGLFRQIFLVVETALFHNCPAAHSIPSW
jgi:hypothetical protein